MGSYGITNNYNEIDVYARYTFKRFSIQYMNYNMPKSNLSVGLFSSVTSYNVGEVSLFYRGVENFPIKFAINTYIYGDSYHSTYSEIGYPIKIGKNSVDLFVGINPYKSSYGNIGVVNAGGTFRYNIKLNDSFSVPTYITICGNPDTKMLFFVYEVTI